MSFEKQHLALPVIMAITTVIVMNAVVGQDGKHPAPIGNTGQHQKIIKSSKPIVKPGLLRRKSKVPGTVAVAPRSKPKIVRSKVKSDGIGRLLKIATSDRKNETSTRAKSLDDKKVRFVQTRLSQLGYAPGPVDGVLGQKTRDAIKKFESARQIPITGDISRALIEALSRSASFARLELT